MNKEKNIHWLIEKDLFEEQRQKIVNSLVTNRYSHSFAKVTPFSHYIEYEPSLAEKDIHKLIVWGSPTLFLNNWYNNTAHHFFNPENFNPRTWIAKRNDMLNQEMIFCKIKDAETHIKRVPYYIYSGFFAKPLDPFKSFPGQVFSCYEEFKARVIDLNINSESVTPNTEIGIYPTIAIKAEYRCFVVNHKLIDVSQYRYKSLFEQAHITNPDILKPLRKLAAGWMPADICVMDVASVLDRYEIIEFNCFNCSGFYDNDVTKITKAVQEFISKRR